MYNLSQQLITFFITIHFDVILKNYYESRTITKVDKLLLKFSKYVIFVNTNVHNYPLDF